MGSVVCRECGYVRWNPAVVCPGCGAPAPAILPTHEIEPPDPSTPSPRGPVIDTKFRIESRRPLRPPTPSRRRSLEVAGVIGAAVVVAVLGALAFNLSPFGGNGSAPSGSGPTVLWASGTTYNVSETTGLSLDRDFPVSAGQEVLSGAFGIERGQAEFVVVNASAGRSVYDSGWVVNGSLTMSTELAPGPYSAGVLAIALSPTGAQFTWESAVELTG